MFKHLKCLKKFFLRSFKSNREINLKSYSQAGRRKFKMVRNKSFFFEIKEFNNNNVSQFNSKGNDVSSVYNRSHFRIYENVIHF